MCLLAAFVPHRPNKYFHVTASNGIVSNSPYTPLAIMTASPIASVRVFDPRCRCRLATFAALPTPSMIEPIIMLTDHPLLAPHRQVRRCHRSIHCWHGHAARRSALPRERFRQWQEPDQLNPPDDVRCSGRTGSDAQNGAFYATQKSPTPKIFHFDRSRRAAG
jgi:hypothetical protein